MNKSDEEKILKEARAKVWVDKKEVKDLDLQEFQEQLEHNIIALTEEKVIADINKKIDLKALNKNAIVRRKK